jgi:hypothetical protein
MSEGRGTQESEVAMSEGDKVQPKGTWNLGTVVGFDPCGKVTVHFDPTNVIPEATRTYLPDELTVVKEDDQ